MRLLEFRLQAASQIYGEAARKEGFAFTFDTA